MRTPVIAKDPARAGVRPHLDEGVRRAFTWEAAARELAGLPGGGLNIAWEAVDRHLGTPVADRLAQRFLGKRGEVVDVTFAQLARHTNRFARALRALGVRRGEGVFALMGRIPELYTAALGTLKAGSVFTPLFSQFGPEPIQTRMAIGRAKALVTTARLYDKKVRPLRAQLPSLEHVLVVGDGGVSASDVSASDVFASDPGVVDLRELLAAQSDAPFVEATRPDELALVHFTSGTTGKPKGAMHVHEAVVVHRATGRYVLDLHDDDVFWCTADPGWVTGTSYGIIAPLTLGVTSIVDEAEFDAERWYGLLAEQKVSVWYTAPTAIRMLMKAGPELPRRFDLSRLRFIGSVGEPLNPEAVWWSQDVLGLPFHDNWWQTETGGIMIANTADLPVKPGSMGKPHPGIEAAIVRQTEHGVEVVDEPGTEGDLALRPGWPSMFRGYLGEEARYRKCFVDGWYITGDLAKKDDDGYYWFVGRADDVIKTSGHLVGPFEVESALMEHPAVAEAAVIGKPDPVAGHVIKAFVVTRPGVVADEGLRLDILGFARTRLGAAVAPKEIDFIVDLPKTRSGKIMRRLLKARELGLPEGDTSTLEGSAS